MNAGMDNRRENGLEFYEKEVGLRAGETTGHTAQEASHQANAFFSKASVFFYALAVFLVPFVFVPVEGLSLQAFKVLVFAFLIIVSGIFYLYSEQHREVSIPRTLFLVLGLLSILFVLSTLFSESFNASFVGGFQGGSFYVLIVGTIAAGLGAQLISTPGRFLILFASLLSGVGVLALLHILRLFLGPEVFSFGILTSTTSTLAGSWYDLGVLFAIVYLLTLSSVVFGALPSRLNRFLTALLFLSLFFLAVTHLLEILLILIFFSLVIFILALKERVRKGAFLILSVTLFLVGLVVFAGPINELTGRVFGTDYVEARPGWQSTLEVAEANLLKPKNLLMGNGPNTFSLMWQDDRSQDVVESNFWSLDFAFGTSTFATYVMTLGVLFGVFLLGWFIYLFVLLFSVRRDTAKIDPFTFMSLRASLFMSLFILLFGFVYVFGVTLFFLLCVFSGVAIGAYARLDSRRMSVLSLQSKDSSYVFGVSVLVLSIIGIHVLALGTSSVLYGRSISQMSTIENPTDFDGINSKLSVARFLDRNDKLERARAESALLEMQLLSTLDESQLTEEAQSRFVEAIERGAKSAQEATRIDPRNYLNWITGGYVFETLGELGIENGHMQAANYYAQARSEHPTNPEIPLIQARLEQAQGNQEAARVFIRESIEMKKSYVNAYALLAQTELAANNEARALAALEEGILASPRNRLLHYELGILHYRLKNFNRAVNAFDSAIESDPNYANALYFRGLAHHTLGDKESSLKDLEKVLAMNEGNQDLARVVNNIRENRNPFLGVALGEGALLPEVGGETDGPNSTLFSDETDETGVEESEQAEGETEGLDEGEFEQGSPLQGIENMQNPNSLTDGAE